MEPIDIFISYRRTDAKAISRLMFDELCRRFGSEHVFFDVDRALLGVEHHRYLSEQVGRCGVVLVVIGDRWAQGPELFTEDDVVQIEVRAALEAGIPILPILADGAVLPLAPDAIDLVLPLMRRDPLPLDSGRDFARHMEDVCLEIERLAWSRTETSRRREGRSDMPTTMSSAPVAAATIPPTEKKSKAASRRLVMGALGAAAAAAAFTMFRAISTSRAPAAALAPPALVASTSTENVARATVSIQASASPIEATLYLDGQPLSSNPYAGQIASDGKQHLLRAEAPGYASGSRLFVANREVSFILALARTGEPAHGPGKKPRPPMASPSAAAAPSASTISKPDDCRVSPSYIDDRNIKVIRPECLRSLSSP